jgi:uridine kinase
MKLCFLITGLLRNFTKSLYVFLKELSLLIDIDLYIYTTKDMYDFKFQATNDINILTSIMNEDFCKLFAVDSSTISNLDYLTQREKNLFYQWKKIYVAFQSIPENEYDYIMRIRPDIQIQLTPLQFLETISSLSKTSIHIPFGNDLYSSKLQISNSSVNDQFAIGSYKLMKLYSEMYLYLETQKYKNSPIISEVILYDYCQLKNLPISRFSLPYTLYLSDCSVLAICGNSGAGKSTLLESLQKVFPFDSSVIIETDRYHKWERHSEEWNKYTHLHPNANNLEKLTDDTYQLKIGEVIEIIDYDHTNGKFTAPVPVQPKHFVFLCGLHTLYKETMRNQLDFKLYIDTEEKLNIYWKVKRDIEKRDHTLESVLKNINKRKNDYEQYIASQKNYADCILYIYYQNELPYYTEELNKEQLSYELTIKKQFLPTVSKLLSTFSNYQTAHADRITYHLHSTIKQEQLIEYIQKEKLVSVEIDKLDSNYLGIIQLLLLFILFK